VMITFLLLGCLGWAGPARIVRAGTRTLVDSDYLVQASASGISRWRLFWRHLLPNLRPILLAQFWISVPLFILSEANLGLLGLGVSEPLPSWGALLRELERMHWNISRTAQALGISRNTLYRKIHKHNIVLEQ